MPINWGLDGKNRRGAGNRRSGKCSRRRGGFRAGEAANVEDALDEAENTDGRGREEERSKEVGFEVLGDLRSGRMKRMAKPRRRGARAMPAVRRPRRGFLDQKMERVR